MREDAATVDVNFVTNGDIVSENCHVLETSPASDGAVPANNGALDPGMVLDLGSAEQDAALKTDAIADHYVRSDGDVGADAAALANLGRWIDQHVATKNERIFRKLIAALLGEAGEVKAGS